MASAAPPERQRTVILGISAFYHDAAAALVVDGDGVAAAQEERFTRVKGDPRFPAAAIEACLQTAGLTLADLTHVVYHEKPWLHFERLLETYRAFAPRGFGSFLHAMPLWLREKLFLRRQMRRRLGWRGPLLMTGHHEAHMAAAFYPSPFERAAILTVDGVGEWATTSFGRGQGAHIERLGELHFPHSLGLLYSAFTAYLGFRVNFGEYKMMGLAPYGQPRYVERILNELVQLRDDGSFRLNMRYFDFATGLRMTNRHFDALFDGPPRAPEGELSDRHMDLARSIQVVTEDILLRMARHVHAQTGEPNLVLAGGVALNCVANGRILREGPFADIWIQPAAGDAGSALGAALAVYHGYLGRPRPDPAGRDRQQGSYLGPAYDNGHIRRELEAFGAVFQELPEAERAAEIARRIAAGQVVGLLQDRMEFGPRALGNRSILGDARSAAMQTTMNLKIKFRESFRPFAPAALVERTADIFELDRPSPYMLLVAPVQPARRRTLSAEEQALRGLDLLHVVRSDLPAITHVDGSARVQTVDAATNPRFHAILQAFEALTGVGCVINTSFNVRGEPIVCTPRDAFRCFMATDMDTLVLENWLLEKSAQPAALRARNWREAFDLD